MEVTIKLVCVWLLFPPGMLSLYTKTDAVIHCREIRHKHCLSQHPLIIIYLSSGSVLFGLLYSACGSNERWRRDKATNARFSFTDLSPGIAPSGVCSVNCTRFAGNKLLGRSLHPSGYIGECRRPSRATSPNLFFRRAAFARK